MVSLSDQCAGTALERLLRHLQVKMPMPSQMSPPTGSTNTPSVATKANHIKMAERMLGFFGATGGAEGAGAV